MSESPKKREKRERKQRAKAATTAVEEIAQPEPTAPGKEKDS